MSLDNVFGIAEKPVEEKKLQVVVREEEVVDELLVYFYKSVTMDVTDLSKFFDGSLTFLRSFGITPQLITKVNNKLPQKKFLAYHTDYKGTFLSALIQTSYEQGFNNFEFEHLQSSYFGSDLQTNKNQPINLKINCLAGGCNFKHSSGINAQIQTLMGDADFLGAKDFSVKINQLVGEAFTYAKNGKIEILNYRNNCGRAYSWRMVRCQIYSPDSQTLKELKRYADEPLDVEFLLGKMPK
ncbi:hypothetical protein HY643_01395 [Candidatus Woesearchaeota archaeon]|nr:hypothetical protein [Candidatus Woesearchaeota archaeon]